MDLDEFRGILSRSRVGIWALIETAIKVANSDYGDELRRRRDKIVEDLYTPPSQLCQSCNGRIQDDGVEEHHYYPNNNNNNNTDCNDNIDSNISNKKCNDGDNRNLNEDFSKSPLTPESNHRNFSGEEGEELDPYGGLFDDEQTKIISIKEQLEDPHQSEDAVVDLLQNLADMDITFQALKETDIGRHVNRLRKHPSNEVRRLVKMVVRKWKETVDEWVKVNQPQATSNLLADGDSPQQNIPKNQQNGHHQVPDFGYSPNPQNGNSSAERNYADYEIKPKPPQSVPRREALSRPPQSVPKSASVPPPNRVKREPVVDDERLNSDQQNGVLQRVKREPVVDDERLNSARRRLQENYQEAENGVILNFVIHCRIIEAVSLVVYCTFLLMISFILIGFCLCGVLFRFVKPKSKGQFRLWIFMRFPNQRMPSLPRTKVAFRGDTIAEWRSFILGVSYNCMPTFVSGIVRGFSESVWFVP